VKKKRGQKRESPKGNYRRGIAVVLMINAGLLNAAETLLCMLTLRYWIAFR